MIQLCPVCKRQTQADEQAYCWHRKPVACRAIGYHNTTSAASRRPRRVKAQARTDLRFATILEAIRRELESV